MIVDDLRHESRFQKSSLLRSHGVVSGMCVVIEGASGRGPFGVLGSFSRHYRAYSADDVNFLQSIANVLAAAIQRQEAERRLQQLNETLELRVQEHTQELRLRAGQLQAMAQQLTQAEQRERERLATVLHDHLQQLLAAANLHVTALGRHRADKGLADGLALVSDLLDQALRSCRNLAVELRPPVLRREALREGMHWLSQWMQEKHQLLVHVHAEHACNVPDEELRVLIFESVRELLFNVVKHAGVQHASVRLYCEDADVVEVVVEDHGRGYQPEALASPATLTGGLGLFGVRERLDLLGGELQIRSRPGAGTRVTLRVPRQRPAAR